MTNVKELRVLLKRIPLATDVLGPDGAQLLQLFIIDPPPSTPAAGAPEVRKAMAYLFGPAALKLLQDGIVSQEQEVNLSVINLLHGIAMLPETIEIMDARLVAACFRGWHSYIKNLPLLHRLPIILYRQGSVWAKAADDFKLLADILEGVPIEKAMA